MLEQVNGHTHPPSSTACEVAKVNAAVKRKVEGTNDSNRQILSSELISYITPTAAANLPSMGTLCRNIREAPQERKMHLIREYQEIR